MRSVQSIAYHTIFYIKSSGKLVIPISFCSTDMYRRGRLFYFLYRKTKGRQARPGDECPALEKMTRRRVPSVKKCSAILFSTFPFSAKSHVSSELYVNKLHNSIVSNRLLTLHNHTIPVVQEVMSVYF